MEWNQLFIKKEDWQHKTYEMIKNNLISARENRFVRYDNTKDNHLVMIYGKSQVGKTTLILNMIGLKTECFYEVYETLRAGVPRGNSSTSTAIIYSKSINEQYGCVLASINDISSMEIQYFNEKEMIRKLKNIRQKVENNKVSPDNILFIYIPKNYFIQDYTSDRISIMDMPGVESRNHKEDIHVQNLMTKYIPISSVCIIACRANDIQSLESLELPNHLEWKRMEHRFILVITHAYNDGSTKQYFKTSPSDRKVNFYDYVVDAYTQEIRRILGTKNQTEVYPVDVGDTLMRLCSEEIKSDNDRKEILETKNRVLEDLRKSIISHKGEKLKYALKDLDVIIKNYGENEIQRIDCEISSFTSKVNDKNDLLCQTEQDIVKLREDDCIQVEIDELKEYSNQFSSLLLCISNFSSQIIQYIIDNSLYKTKRNNKYLKDNEQNALSYMRMIVSDSVGQYIEKLNKLIGRADIDITLNSSLIQIEADSFILEKQNSIYPPKKGLFSKREKVYFQNMENICVSIQENINEYLRTYVNSCISKIEILISEKQMQKNKLNNLIKQKEENKQKYHAEIGSLRKKIEVLKSNMDDIKWKKEQDQKTLSMYLHYAKQAYVEQRNSVINQINKSKNSDDKLLLILFLGLLDKDFQIVMGA